MQKLFGGKMMQAVKRSLILGLFAVTLLTPALVSAAPLSLSTGNMYRVLNLSTNKLGQYGDKATAQCGNTLSFRVRLNNSGSVAIPTLLVSATLDGQGTTTHHSTLTTTAPSPVASVDSNQVTVTTDKTVRLTYLKGSTQLLDATNKLLSTLPDGLTSGTPVSIGALAPGVKNEHFVQFTVSVDCQKAGAPAPAPAKSTPTLSHSANTPTAVSGSAPLANTGPGSPLLVFLGVSVFAGLAHLLWRRYDLTRALRSYK